MKSQGVPEQQIQILFADSDPDLQDMFQEYCQLYTNASVTAVSLAKEALEKSTSVIFDVLILADNLPDMVLKDVLLTLQKVQSSPPVILFTDHECNQITSSDETFDFCLRKGKWPARKFEELLSLSWKISEQQQALLQGSENEQRLHDIINFLPDATFVINKEGVVIAWNKAIEDLTGVPAENMIGKGNYEYSIPFYQERRPILIDLILSRDVDVSSHYHIIDRQDDKIIVDLFIPTFNNGKGIYLWAIASPLYDLQGTIVGAIESIRDITKRRQTEDAMNESEIKFRSLVETSPDMIWELDNRGNFQYVSPKSKEILGYEPEDLLGHSIQTIISPEYVDDYRTLFSKVYADSSFTTFEVLALRRDGQQVILEIRSVPITDENGVVTGLRGVCRDITEQKTNQEKLLLSEQRARTYLENSPAGVLVFNTSLEFIDFNARALELTGYTRPELLKMTVPDMIPSEYRSAFNEKHDKLKKERIAFGESAILKKDGSTISILVNVATLPDGNYLAYISDISERKEFENKLRESEELYHALFENITDTVMLHGFTSEGLPDTFIAVNESACRQLGYTRDELLQMSVADIEEPSSYTLAQSRADDLKTKGHAIFEATQMRKDGSTIPVEISAHVFNFRDRRVVLALGRDIRERKEFEKKLRESEERYSSLFYQNYSVSLLIDPDSARIVDANTAACDYYGYSHEKLTHLSLPVINGVPKAKILKDLNQAKEESEKHFKSVHRLADGSKRNVEVYSGPIIIGGKKLFYSIIHDITDETQAKEKLVKLLEERTTLLMEIHHRVNNNLQVLLSLATLERISFKEEIATDSLADKLLSDMENRISAIALVHENLFLSGDLTEIQLVEHLRILAQGILTSEIGGVYISFTVDGNDDIVMDLDRAVLVSLVASEILMNVQKHAFVDQKFGNVIITVADEPEKKQLSIGIRDDGIGLPEEIDPEQTESVGLSLIIKIVRMQLHGTITVSREGGTGYLITLPR